jgi:hypothetical protein
VRRAFLRRWSRIAQRFSTQPFVHQALVTLPADGDDRGPGGAVTLALCGSLDHPPPCPLAPHHTSVERSSDGVLVRIVFVCRLDDETRVRNRIDDALAGQVVTGPDGLRRTWSVGEVGPGVLRPVERALAARLASG